MMKIDDCNHDLYSSCIIYGQSDRKWQYLTFDTLQKKNKIIVARLLKHIMHTFSSYAPTAGQLR